MLSACLARVLALSDGRSLSVSLREGVWSGGVQGQSPVMGTTYICHERHTLLPRAGGRVHLVWDDFSCDIYEDPGSNNPDLMWVTMFI